MPYKNKTKRRVYHRLYERRPEAKAKARARQKTKHGKRLQKFNRLRWLYGLSKEQYIKLFESTSGKCPLCSIKFCKQSRRGASAVIDHDHITGTVRGIICFNCNVMIGNAKDSIDTLQKAIKYLKKWKS